MGESNGLTNESVERYSRQLIMPEIGVTGQVKLKNARVLIVGAGGLGCPAAQYLVAAGVGTIGIVDYDEVEVSNLHRQILHSEKGAKEKWRKAESAAKALKDLNSRVNVIPMVLQLDQANAFEIFMNYDLVIDATDNVSSRYLISDVCVLTNKPLVSGSALRWEGQLTVYNYTDTDGVTGPCYRCLYPVPPPPEAVTNCSDGGVIGVVPGIIGCMQALEAMKIITGVGPSFHKKLYLFDGLSGSARTVKLRPRQASCICCGENPEIKLADLPDYTKFCGSGPNDKCRMLKILDPGDRISVKEYKALVDKEVPHVLVDVRNAVELDICSLPDCVNVPMGRLQAMEACGSRLTEPNTSKTFIEVDHLKIAIYQKSTLGTRNSDETHKSISSEPVPVYVLCRMGNDSQKAVRILRENLRCDTPAVFKDIKGGLMAWADQIDNLLPRY